MLILIMKNNIMVRKNVLIVIVSLLILLFCINNFFLKETFESSLDSVDEMEKKMNELSDVEEETRMFCKILRHDEDKQQMKNLLENRNQQFQDSWKKQNKIISDIKKKFINLRLEKDGRNFVEFNDTRNKKSDENSKRKKIIEKAKQVANSPYNLNLNINNNSL